MRADLGIEVIDHVIVERGITHSKNTTYLLTLNNLAKNVEAC
jgi:hypothetical protein